MIANLAVCALPLVPAHAQNQRDMLLVILEEEVSGKNGAHQRLMTRDKCLEVLQLVENQTRQGLRMTLSLLDPPATGRVVAAHCIHPDGSYDSVEVLGK